MLDVTMQDGTAVEVAVQGEGPAILLPFNPVPITGDQADELRKWGFDPALGKTMMDGLTNRYRVVAFDYEGYVRRDPKPDTLTADYIARDFLTIADAAGADVFAYYGYSWLAMAGMQLALRTDRLSALVMGGYPPLGGPYREMLQVTRAALRMSLDNEAKPPEAEAEVPATIDTDPADYDWDNVKVTALPPQAKQFLTLYESLSVFDDHAAQSQLSCPRCCFAGSADRIEYNKSWGEVTVDIARPLLQHRERLEALGWQVRVLDGLDHTAAMQPPAALPVLRAFLDSIEWR
jgi:Predicted hydrolases or acyltransferases (alpha/beta hydrolase superfamily)